MAYRRKQEMISKSATCKEPSPLSAAPICHFKTKKTLTSSYSFSSTSTSKGLDALEYSRNDSKGFWRVLVRKAKAILDDDDNNLDTPSGVSTTSQKRRGPSDEGFRRTENPRIRRGLDKLNSSLKHIGDTFEKAFEEGRRTIVENKTQKMRRKEAETQVADAFTTTIQQQQRKPTLGDLLNLNNHKTRLKASRDVKVAMATAAKGKLLLWELKSGKEDLAFAKERCAQLEEEIKILRESKDKGNKGESPEDDDLIRVQLESLLAEKAHLARENSIYARENRFLREIVEFHQLSMQDVYFDEGAEDVTEVGDPINFPFSNLFESPPLSPSHPCTTSTTTEDEILPDNIPSTR